MSPHHDHRRPLVAFVALFVIAMLVLGNGLRARAADGSMWALERVRPYVVRAVGHVSPAGPSQAQHPSPAGPDRTPSVSRDLSGTAGRVPGVVGATARDRRTTGPAKPPGGPAGRAGHVRTSAAQPDTAGRGGPHLSNRDARAHAGMPEHGRSPLAQHHRD